MSQTIPPSRAPFRPTVCGTVSQETAKALEVMKDRTKRTTSDIIGAAVTEFLTHEGYLSAEGFPVVKDAFAGNRGSSAKS